ncbi:MAG: glycosyltransferase [Pirellulaceae bacterium]|nr:glycosyltransferase [Pirellulaceae bacterium]
MQTSPAEQPQTLRLLLVAYPFPPSPAIGAVRAWAMAKYLSRLGWQVTVLTPRPADSMGADAIQAADEQCQRENIHRLFAGHQFWPPTQSWTKQPGRWGSYLLQRLLSKLLGPFGLNPTEMWWLACRRSLGRICQGSFDVVLTTGSPFYPFQAVQHFAAKHKIPFVLDYRDPWTANNLTPTKIQRSLRRLENRVVADAAEVVMISPSQALWQAQHVRLNRSAAVIHNGYDPEQLHNVQATQFSDLAIVYTGEFYPGQREIDPIIKVIVRANEFLGSSSRPIRLHYYGRAGDYVNDKATQYGAQALVECHGRVPRSQALAAVKGSHLTAVIAGIADQADLDERGIVTGKIFEPLGLGVPILLIAPEGNDAAAILEETGAGRSFRASQIEEMAGWLVEQASISKPRQLTPPANYAWPHLASKLDVILRQVIDRQFNL